MVHGLLLALRAMSETLGISAPTVVDSVRARMSIARGDARLASWSRRLLEQAEVRLSVSGGEHVEPGRAYVVMSNHQSHYDVPVLFQAVPTTLRMVAKTELFKIPVFGRAMTAAGFIEIDRSNRQRAIASLSAARDRLAQGVSIWIAPEGTRSRTGELQPFKKGGFVLALETGLAVLPVGIVGSRDILAADAMVVRPGARVHVAIRPPIPPRAPAGDTSPALRDALMAEVREAILAAIAAGRTRLAGEPAAG
jgi:1-acyl-sn-glycerol-3-phosphate acyltransferase